jgi:hypothetical protein
MCQADAGAASWQAQSKQIPAKGGSERLRYTAAIAVR